MVSAAESIVAFLQGKGEFDAFAADDSVTLMLAPEGGGGRARVAREELRDRSRWRIPADDGSTYRLLPPAANTVLTAREATHFNCQEYALMSRYPELAARPHVGVRLAPPGQGSCLQTWNATFIFNEAAAGGRPVLSAVVYDQWEW
jgi:hypothetical protein